MTAASPRIRRIELGQVRTDNQFRIAFIIANIGTSKLATRKKSFDSSSLGFCAPQRPLC